MKCVRSFRWLWCAAALSGAVAQTDDVIVDDGGDIGETPPWVAEDTAADDAAAVEATRRADADPNAGARTRPKDAPAPSANGTADSTPSAVPEPRPADFSGTSPEEALKRAAAGNHRPSAETVQLPDADDLVVSQSGIFTVSGADSMRLGAIATHADDLAHRLNTLLKLTPEHKYGISIRLLGKSTDAPQLRPVRTRIRIIDGQPNFQVRVYPGGGIDLEKMDKGIITMLLYERALRGLDPEAYPESIELPDWLVTGLSQALLWRSGKADRNMYRGLFERAEMLSPEEIISVENPATLDAATRQVYDVSCGVLMMALLTREGGAEALTALLDEAATSDAGPKEMIGEHFHELGLDRDLLNKWWALQLADLSLSRADEAMTPLESEKQLAEALTVLWFDPKTQTPTELHVENIYGLMQHEDWKELITPCMERLVRLSALAFPAYRTIITEYCRVLAELMNGGDPDEAQNRLGPLLELRQAYVAAATRGRDYLDWYEINFLGGENRRSFDSYLEAMHMLRREKTGPETPISAYLDDIEALHDQQPGAELPERLRKQIPERKKGVEKP